MVGFDDIPSALTVDPELTTVRQPIERIGQLAVETVIALVDAEAAGRTEPSTQRFVLPTELVVRGSCGSQTAR